MLLALGATTARADWPINNDNNEKVTQGPDPYNGFDILVGQGPETTFPPIILANDFQCFKTGQITDIHLWTSWFGLDSATTIPPIPITLGIWSDVPATNGPGGTVSNSHPGQLLWTNTFLPGQYKVRPWATAYEPFWDPDPAPQGIILGPDFQIWQYNFYPPAANTFTQTGSVTAPITYWLSMSVSNVQTTGAPKFFGWKTSTNVVLDNSVFGHLDAAGNPVGDWQELLAPASPVSRSLDLSFVLTTSEVITNPLPPPPITNKWVQFPNTNGFDINAIAPYIVADDFKCTNSSPITNVQIWASFQNDQPPDPTMGFILGIWSDVLAPPSFTGANPGYSRPGRLLCSNIFGPNEYTFTPAGTGNEFFYDPASGSVTHESQIWLYNFDLKTPCCQQGSTNSPMTYWLSITALPAGTTLPSFGWKTTTNHYRDDAVFGRPDAAGNIFWQELFDPIQTAAKVSLELAFVINNGPPNPDCEPNLHCKWKEAPDTTPNGMDVLATSTNVLGDDYLCVKPGLISGITVFGSWLDDNVDSNAVFQLSLWTDVQGVPGTQTNYSHPGIPLCTTLFNPPQTKGTWLDRYQYRLYKDNLTESFFSPDLGTSGFLGNDSKIWRYDFYPNQFGASCWRQFGSPFNQGNTYWIVLSYLPPTGTANQFGWKTALTHVKDDAVFGHIDPTTNLPLGDWKDLHDPRSSTLPSKDLAFRVCDFPVTSKNADIVNTTGAAVDGIQVIVPGQKIITAHYDGVPAWTFQPPVWAGGNTILQWSGQTIPAGGTTHVGWEYAGAGVKCLSINWTIGNVVIQPPVPEVNFVGLNNIGSLVLLNDIAQIPLGVSGGMVEFHSDAVSLDQMNPNGNRQDTLLATAPLQLPPDKMMPGGAMLIPMPTNAPAGARYAMFMINLADPTTDFILLPLDTALQPVIDSVSLDGSSIDLTFSSAAGRSYRVQYKTDLTVSGWTDSALGDIYADSAETSASVPLNGAQSYYRVELLPQ
jgi:hypothetical protein